MNKKKLGYVVKSLLVIILVMCLNISFSKQKINLELDNIEALGEGEIDIFKLCPRSGGICCVNIDLNYNGISIDRD